MKVLIINERGRDFGSGAVISTYRLHRGLIARGIDSVLACRGAEPGRDDVVELPRADRVERVLGQASWRIGLNDIHCLSSFKLHRFQPFIDADLVNIRAGHCNYFSYLAIPGIARAKPLVVSLHDMWNFTGHCAYSGECDRWKSGCGKCPDLKAYPPVRRDATAIEWRLKRRVYEKSEMIVTTPSRWLADTVGESILGRFPVQFVPNGVDTLMYRPRDRAECRKALSIDPDGYLIMFAAASLDDRRKGGDLLLDALRGMPDPVRKRSQLLVIGDRGGAITGQTDLPVIDLGYVYKDRLKALCYAAADVFVLPTRDEVQGRVLLEALACGTPCVGFGVGGVGESVIPGRTGYLAAPEDADDLGRGIVEILSNGEGYATRCREHILEHNTMDIHLDGFIDVYEEALGMQKARETERQAAA